ncbi:Tat pathway signal sequence domain protein [Streptomyces acidicola]|uniref:Tat pathway signal sequence domain protein n=1 Tax=Streptomyces acidicola TaxID=2596892 RepID=UPI003812AFF5
MTEAEVDRARSLALGGNSMPGARSVTGRPGPEYLDADLADSAVPTRGEVRRAEVLFYDYGSDKLVKRTVNLTAGKVERTDTAAGVQPPPSPEETDRAAGLLIKSALGAGLREDFKAATRGTELTSASQLTLQGISYNTAVQSGPAALADCGTHRCVRLFTQVKGGPWIDTTNLVIDLSDSTVRRIHA